MKNLNQLGVTELEITETINATGGGCSFAYDVGFVLRVLFHAGGGPAGSAQVATDIALYDHHCNND